MATLEGKHFSITDQKDVRTIIYEVNKEEKSEKGPKFTIQKLDYTEEIRGENIKKTFFIDEPLPDGNSLVILSFASEKVVVNTGLLLNDKVFIKKKPMPVKFDTLYSEDTQYKEFDYTPNLRRTISIIDPETTEEIKPILYFDEKTNEVKGKCKLKPYKSYFAFEIRDDS